MADLPTDLASRITIVLDLDGPEAEAENTETSSRAGRVRAVCDKMVSDMRELMARMRRHVAELTDDEVQFVARGVAPVAPAPAAPAPASAAGVGFSDPSGPSTPLATLGGVPAPPAAPLFVPRPEQVRPAKRWIRTQIQYAHRRRAVYRDLRDSWARRVTEPPRGRGVNVLREWWCVLVRYQMQTSEEIDRYVNHNVAPFWEGFAPGEEREELLGGYMDALEESTLPGYEECVRVFGERATWLMRGHPGDCLCGDACGLFPAPWQREGVVGANVLPFYGEGDETGLGRD